MAVTTATGPQKHERRPFSTCQLENLPKWKQNGLSHSQQTSVPVPIAISFPPEIVCWWKRRSNGTTYDSRHIIKSPRTENHQHFKAVRNFFCFYQICIALLSSRVILLRQQDPNPMDDGSISCWGALAV